MSVCQQICNIPRHILGVTLLTGDNICYDTGMALSSPLKVVTVVLEQHRLFTIVLIVMLFLLLIRIPLGTFNYPAFIDTIAHFVLPAVSAPLIAELFIKLRYLPLLGGRSLLLIIVLVALGVEVIWEIFEYFIDVMLQLNWQLSNADTMMDIMLSITGGIVGGYIFLKLYRNRS